MSLCERDTPGPSPSPSPGPAPAPPRCVGGYGQCGGKAYKGPHCCVAGYQCEPGNPSDPSFLQCKPKRPNPPPPPRKCVAAYGQCGGKHYHGASCCVKGYMCAPGNPSDPSFLQCVPARRIDRITAVDAA